MKYQIKIEGMSCKHCLKRVQEALLENFKPQNLDVSLEDNAAIMEVQAALEKQQIIDVIDDAGYDVLSIEILD